MQRRARRRTRFGYYLRSAVSLLTRVHAPLQTARIFSPFPPREPATIHLRRTGATFRVRGATDVWSVKEAWLDRFYERYGFRIEPGWTVVDIGAGIGEFTLLAAVSGACAVAFEPSPVSFDLLCENTTLNDANGIVAIQKAISGGSGITRIDIDGDPLTARTGDEKGIEVQALSLEDALEEAGVRHVDLLKIDCEGGEYDILASAAHGTLRRVDRIVMEFHDIDAGHTSVHLIQLLDAAGYRVETFPNPVHTWTGYLRADRLPLSHSSS